MKIQMQAQQLRLRIDEAELATLLDTGQLENVTWLGRNVSCCQRIEIVESEVAVLASASLWQVQITRSELEGHLARLPCRDGLQWTVPVAQGRTLLLDFEIDVRDSVRKRGPRRRDKPAPGEDRH